MILDRKQQKAVLHPAVGEDALARLNSRSRLAQMISTMVWLDVAW